MSKAIKRGKSWNIRVYSHRDADGKIHTKSFTAPTKAEVEWMAADFKKNRKGIAPIKMTVGDAVDKYIKLRPMLSPTTLTDYEKHRKYAFKELMNTPVDELNDIVMQEAINEEAMRISERTGKVISVKTLKNEYGLVEAALKTVCKKTFIVTLPKKHKHQKVYPEVPKVIDAIKDTDIELPCLLSLWLTFRMSEVRGLRCSDYKDGYLNIDRVMVETDKGTIVKDNAKTQASLRKRKVSPYLHQLIISSESWKKYEGGEDGYLIPMTRDKIYRHWKKICKENGWQLTYHDLRHLSASSMVFLGIPLRYAMEFGGWGDNETLQSVYQHTLADERGQFEDIINNYFEEKLK